MCSRHGESEALHRAAFELRLETHRMDHRAAVADVQEVDDAVLARFEVELDLDEGGDKRR